MQKMIIILLIIMGQVLYAYAAFEDYGWGTHGTALGGAYVCLANDTSAAFYNPAGVGVVEKSEVSFMYSGLLTGLDMESVGLMYSGVVYHSDVLGGVGFNWARFQITKIYSEDTFILTYANQLNKLFNQLKSDTYLGINLKLFKSQFTINNELRSDPVFSNGDNKMTVAFDIGCLIKLDSIYGEEEVPAFGISIFNINKPDIGLKQEDVVPMQIKGGFSYPLKIKDTFFEKLAINSSIPLISVSYVNEKDINVHLGWENNFYHNLISFRLGGNLNELATGLGIKYRMSKIWEILFNYTFTYPLKIKDSSGSHRTSLAIRF